MKQEIFEYKINQQKPGTGPIVKVGIYRLIKLT